MEYAPCRTIPQFPKSCRGSRRVSSWCHISCPPWRTAPLCQPDDTDDADDGGGGGDDSDDGGGSEDRDGGGDDDWCTLKEGLNVRVHYKDVNDNDDNNDNNNNE